MTSRDLNRCLNKSSSPNIRPSRGRELSNASTSYLKNRSNFASWRSCSPLTLHPVTKLNGTITIDSSTDSDFINDSVQEIPAEIQAIKTPRICRTRGEPVKGESSSIKAAQTLSRRTSDSPVRKQAKLETTYNPFLPSEATKTSHRHGPKLLVKSKHQNILQWLAGAAATEPAPPMTPSPEPVQDENDSPTDLDPLVKEFLIAVYGDGWKDQLVKKFETDLKRKRPSIHATRTDVKARKLVLEEPSSKSVRRNIFSTPVNRGLNSPALNFKNNQFKSDAKNVRRKISVNPERNEEVLAPTPVMKRMKKDLNVTPTSPLLVPMPPLSSKRKKRKTSCSSDELPPVNTPSAVSTRSSRTPRKTFLASLSVTSPTSVSHPEAQIYKFDFAKKKEELSERLFKLYNKEIFNSQLPEGMQISWNPKMRGTAGYCYNKRIIKGGTVVARSARIELATRVVDRAERVRDTLVHELCHAAAWVIDGVLNGHGAIWRKWVDKAQERFPELPPITRSHNYEIASKFTYRCIACGYSINRHSKSIDLGRKRCGHCRGKFEILVNKKKRGKKEEPEFDTTRTMRTPNAFALFVKENYKKVKDADKGKKHGEVMQILSKQYAVYKQVLTPGKVNSGKKEL